MAPTAAIFDQAVRHQQANRLEDAATTCRQILAVDPKHADATHLLGIVTHQLGSSEPAIGLVRQAIALNPGVPEYYCNLGLICLDLRRWPEAIAAFSTALQLRPAYATALCYLGNALREVGRLEEAAAAYRRAVAAKGDFFVAYSNLGNVLRELNRLDESADACRRAIAINPNFAAAHNNLANALNKSDRLDEAVGEYRRALALQPGYAEARSNLGNALKDMGRLDEAIAAYREALAQNPNLPECHGNLLYDLHYRADFDPLAVLQESREWERRFAPPLTPAGGFAPPSAGGVAPPSAGGVAPPSAGGVAPPSAGGVAPPSAGGVAPPSAGGFVPPSAGGVVPPPAERFAPLPTGGIAPSPTRAFALHGNSRDANRRLTIGYVSPDFRQHAVSAFLLPLLQAHDRKAFRIACISNVRAVDHVTAAIRQSVDIWRDIVAIPDDKAAELIRADGVDILIDLAGHTAQNRLRLFALKPAPIQMTWLGYPGTTGLSAIDFRVTDPLADPPGLTESHFAEKLLRLPRTNWCFAPIVDGTSVCPLPAESSGRIRFGSFSNFAKITNAMQETWAKILLAVPNSSLTIKAKALSDPATRARVHQRFLTLGVAPTRLDLRGRLGNPADHLAAYGQIDIALDTFPYHGTTTTCEALWMGVPVVTLAGSAHVSRVGVSLLTNVGLPELIAQTPEQYIQIAAQLAADVPALAQRRAGLRPQMAASPLMDAAGFARDMEDAFRRAWRTELSGT